MNPTILYSLRLTKAIAQTHQNPLPLLRLWTAIVETYDRNLAVESHKIVGNDCLVHIIENHKELVDQPVEPYTLDDATLLDQIFADLGETL